jgi:hypothetical protein
MEKTCRLCFEPETANNPLLQPCSCSDYVHKECLNKMRNITKNSFFFAFCSTCKTRFSTKKIKLIDDEVQISNLAKQREKNMIRFIFKILLLYFAFVVFISLFSWLCDQDNKNIPVFMKIIGTSVITDTKIPSNENISMWRHDFEKKDIKTWYYYAFFGVFITSLYIVSTSVCNCYNPQFRFCDCYYFDSCSYVDVYEYKYGRGTEYDYFDLCGCKCQNCNCKNCIMFYFGIVMASGVSCGGFISYGGIFLVIFVMALGGAILIILFSAPVCLFGYAIKIIISYIMIYNDINKQYILELNGIIEICDREEISVPPQISSKS